MFTMFCSQSKMHLRLAAVVGLMEEEANQAEIRPWCDVWFQVLL